MKVEGPGFIGFVIDASPWRFARVYRPDCLCWVHMTQLRHTPEAEWEVKDIEPCRLHYLAHLSNVH